MIDINITTAVIIIIVVVDINVDFSLLLFSLYNEPHETRRPSVGARQWRQPRCVREQLCVPTGRQPQHRREDHRQRVAHASRCVRRRFVLSYFWYSLIYISWLSRDARLYARRDDRGVVFALCDARAARRCVRRDASRFRFIFSEYLGCFIHTSVRVHRDACISVIAVHK